MPYFLDLCYLLLIFVSLPWLIKEAVTKGKYREGFATKFLGIVPRRASSKKCLWFHAVSVGEVNLLEPLLKKIKAQRPDWECVISTTTKTGMALAKKKYTDLTVFYCPLDFTWATATAMRRIRPDVLVLAELELWPNLIRAAKRRGAKVAVINGRLSEHSYKGYRHIRFFIGRLLRKLDVIAVQDETYAGRFADLGAGNKSLPITGSMKYDGAETDRKNAKTVRLSHLAGIAADDIVFLAGSTQSPEEEAAIGIFKRLADEFPQLKLILVPRHPERFAEVANLLDQSGVSWRRRTTLDENAPSKNLRVMLVDCVGELGAWWGTAKIAFVGGSFGQRGGQNMIEPAAYGAAVSFGPNTWNFRDIVATILDHQAAVVVKDESDLESFVRRCLSEPSYAIELGQRAQSLVKAQLGATDKTLGLLEGLVR